MGCGRHGENIRESVDCVLVSSGLIHALVTSHDDTIGIRRFRAPQGYVLLELQAHLTAIRPTASMHQLVFAIIGPFSAVMSKICQHFYTNRRNDFASNFQKGLELLAKLPTFRSPTSHSVFGKNLSLFTPIHPSSCAEIFSTFPPSFSSLNLSILSSAFALSK